MNRGQLPDPTGEVPSFTPDWPLPSTVRALITLRTCATDETLADPLAGFNLGLGRGGDAAAHGRREQLARLLPRAPLWPRLVHGNHVAHLRSGTTEAPVADAVWADAPGVVCAVLTADCLPVLFATRDGEKIAAAHAGWRGLAAGVLENTVAAFGAAPGDVLAYLGPAIGPAAFEIGPEVRDALLADGRGGRLDGSAFRARPGDKFLADLAAIARQRLGQVGVTAVYGGGFCTHTEARRFYSHRRDPRSGRMDALIWLADSLVTWA